MEAQTAQKTHWKKQFNYDYLGSYSFAENETVKVLTIGNVQKEMVIGTGGKKEQLLVCHFRENEKPMILNRTNCKAISKAYGTPYTEDWAGLRISIYVQQGIKVGSDVTDGLRIKDEKPGNEITLDALKSLLEKKSGNLNEAERANVQQVIDSTTTSRYRAAYDFLNAK